MKFSKILIPVFVLSLFVSQTTEAAGWRRAGRSIAWAAREGFVNGAQLTALLAGGLAGMVVVVYGGAYAVVGVSKGYDLIKERVLAHEAEARKERPPTGGGIGLSPDLSEHAMYSGVSDTQVGTDEYGRQCSILDVVMGCCRSVSFEKATEDGEVQRVVVIREGDEETLNALKKKYGTPAWVDER